MSAAADWVDRPPRVHRGPLKNGITDEHRKSKGMRIPGYRRSSGYPTGVNMTKIAKGVPTRLDKNQAAQASPTLIARRGIRADRRDHALRGAALDSRWHVLISTSVGIA